MAKDPKPETTKPDQPTNPPPQTDPTAPSQGSGQESGQGSEEGVHGPDVLKEATEKGYLGEQPEDQDDLTVEGVIQGPDVTDPEYAEQKGVEPSEEPSEGQTK